MIRRSPTDSLALIDPAGGERYDEIRSRAREVSEQLSPFAAEADEMLTVHPQMRAVLAASGLVKLVVPAAYGGEDETLDPLAIAIVREEFMYNSAHLDGLFAMQGIGSYPLSVGGNDEVRQQWLPRVASLDAIPALALTEPEVGSDLRSITTTVTAVGDDLRVSGKKAFITNAGEAAFYCVLAREDDGYSMVLVPADAEGVSCRVGPDIIAPHVLGEVDLESVVVPSNHRLGIPGRAFHLMLETLATFRVTVAGAAVGLARAALDEALAHTTRREQFGRPLASHGAVSQGLGHSWVEVETARAITYLSAARARSNPLSNLDQSSIAKVAATEAANRVADRSLQSMGRFGLVRGSKIERLYRNARPMRVYEGATEVLLDSLARRIVRDWTKAMEAGGDTSVDR